MTEWPFELTESPVGAADLADIRYPDPGIQAELSPGRLASRDPCGRRVAMDCARREIDQAAYSTPGAEIAMYQT